MIEQHLEDGSANPAWLAARAGKFTGSRFADLMARTKSGPSTSRANLLATLAVERITGSCVEMFTNSAMARGTELEPVARSAYEASLARLPEGDELRGMLVEEVGFCQSAEMGCVGVSPDGLIGADGLIEIKCPSAIAKHLEALRSGGASVYAEYRWQVQGQLWVTDRAWCDVVSFDPRWPDGLQLAIHRVLRDEVAIDELRVGCAAGDLEVQAILSDLLALRGAA